MYCISITYICIYIVVYYSYIYNKINIFSFIYKIGITLFRNSDNNIMVVYINKIYFVISKNKSYMEYGMYTKNI